MKRLFITDTVRVYIPTFDPDAQAFITAAGITNSTQQNAINQLVLSLKSYSIWTKMHAIYPMVGGTATSHKFNLKNPADSDNAFRLTFNGAWTHSSTGATPTSGTGWANTYYVTSINGVQDSCHVSYYVRNHVAGGFTEMGVDGTTSYATNIAYNFNGTAYPANQATQDPQGGASSTPSYWINSRTNSSNYGWFRNTTKTTINKASSVLSGTLQIALGGFQTGPQVNYAGSGRECAFATIGTGLTDAEVANLYTTVQAYQTTLGRQV